MTGGPRDRGDLLQAIFAIRAGLPKSNQDMKSGYGREIWSAVFFVALSPVTGCKDDLRVRVDEENVAYLYSGVLITALYKQGKWG